MFCQHRQTAKSKRPVIGVMMKTPAIIDASMSAGQRDSVEVPPCCKTADDVTAKLKIGGASVPLALLAACGAGSTTGTTSAPTATVGTAGVTVTKAPPTEAEASRFLTQASMGATRASIADVIAKGYEGWIDAQLAMPRAQTLWAAMEARGETGLGNVNSSGGIDASIWRSLIVEPDQLRQRVAMALLDFLVFVSPFQSVWPQMHAAGFVDILMDNAFGNYRTILDKITYNPAMAIMLTYLNNRKADSATGTQPDENYARELMQLFTIGLHQMNRDGSLKMANGQPIYTYTQSDVSQLARVFTGMVLDDWDWKKATVGLYPIRVDIYTNETGTATFLGTSVTGGGKAAVTKTLNTLFNHPNIAPFISRQLIQRLVTSNPSPGYIDRVATVFEANDEGVRGDLGAVVKAILLDTEARSGTALSSNTAGRLRAPVLRLTAWARAFNATSPSNAWAIGSTAEAATGLAQSPARASSVFNFFRPGYTPPGSQIQAQGLVAPEFQMTTELSIAGYVNFMYKAVGDGIGDVKADYGALTALAGNTDALVAEVNLVLAAGQLSAGSIATIKGGVDSASSPAAKACIAVLLALTAPEFLVTR